MNLSRVRLLADKGDHYLLHDGAAEFRVPKNGLSKEMHERIQSFAGGGRSKASTGAMPKPHDRTGVDVKAGTTLDARRGRQAVARDARRAQAHRARGRDRQSPCPHGVPPAAGARSAVVRRPRLRLRPPGRHVGAGHGRGRRRRRPPPAPRRRPGRLRARGRRRPASGAHVAAGRGVPLLSAASGRRGPCSGRADWPRARARDAPAGGGAAGVRDDRPGRRSGPRAALRRAPAARRRHPRLPARRAGEAHHPEAAGRRR
jgi:hypothetical protein